MTSISALPGTEAKASAMIGFLPPATVHNCANVTPTGSQPTIGEWYDECTRDARLVEYSRAADPIGSGAIRRIPLARFGPDLYVGQPTRVIPLDLSEQLETAGPATSPGLLASFIRIRAGEGLSTSPNATSELYYVMEGHGFSTVNGGLYGWEEGDFLTLPAGSVSVHRAAVDATLYWVTDEPLLQYLGVRATDKRFNITRFRREAVLDELEKAANAPDANERSRVSTLLVNAEQEQTLTVTHVLWAMVGIVPPGRSQRPHRHQSVAVDLIVKCEHACYTLVGDRIDDHGDIIDPVRIDWEPGGAFVTPPGMWHSHHNDSGEPAYLIPIQDAGMQTYLRTLDIQFSPRKTDLAAPLGRIAG